MWGKLNMFMVLQTTDRWFYIASSQSSVGFLSCFWAFLLTKAGFLGFGFSKFLLCLFMPTSIRLMMIAISLHFCLVLKLIIDINEYSCCLIKFLLQAGSKSCIKVTTQNMPTQKMSCMWVHHPNSGNSSWESWLSHWSGCAKVWSYWQELYK